MIPVSQLHREAVAYSRTLLVVVDIWKNGVLLYADVPVLGGSFKADRASKTRLNCDIVIAKNTWEPTNVDVRTCRFNVKRGITSLGVADQVSLGWFRVSDIDRSSRGLLTIKGDGLEVYIDDARFLQPRTPTYGVVTTAHITTLITEILPTATVRRRNTTDRRVLMTAPWPRERWDAIDTLAQSINSEVFANYAGEFIIQDIPSATAGVPVFWFDEGTGEVLVTRSEKETRDRMYNAVSVQGSSTDPNVPPVWAWAYDSNPLSETYYYGSFGQVPRFYTSQFFSTSAQCQAVADNMLAEALAENKKLSFTSVPIDFLEVGDLVGVRREDGTLEGHLLQSISYNLGVDGGFSAETLSFKSIIADGV